MLPDRGGLSDTRGARLLGCHNVDPYILGLRKPRRNYLSFEGAECRHVAGLGLRYRAPKLEDSNGLELLAPGVGIH